MGCACGRGTEYFALWRETLLAPAPKVSKKAA